MPAPSELPPQVRAAHDGWEVRLLQAPYSTATWKLRSQTDDVRFVKVAWDDLYPSLADERDRMSWARRHLHVPEVVDYGRQDGIEWLVTTWVPGTDATRVSDDPESVVRALAEGLRRFHETPTDDCPFDFTLDVALEHVARRVHGGREMWDDLHEEYKHMTPVQVLEELLRTRPSSEDVVVCHGDYCFPNMLLEDGVVTGYLDLGELGLADRWWDIAVGAWSVTWNVDPKWEPAFYESYGVEPDPERIRFYRLLYDLAS
jgi:kanamycin kinase